MRPSPARQRITSAVALLLLVTTSALALAGGPPTLEIVWHTTDGGGGTSSGGVFELSGTIGQPDAGQPMIGGTFEVRGGFWSNGGGLQPCVADCGDSDGVVGTVDLLALLAQWGQPGSCDIDPIGDGIVATTDLLDLLAAWGPCG